LRVRRRAPAGPGRRRDRGPRPIERQGGPQRRRDGLPVRGEPLHRAAGARDRRRRRESGRRRRLAGPAVVIAFIFPGQGSQQVGMGLALARTFPICRQAFDEADDALGEPLSRICFEGPESVLTLTENTQPAILAVSIAATRLLASRGITPAFVAGHSLGEYSANVAAGTFAFADALRIVRKRGRYMQDAVPVGAGAMAAILGLDADQVAEACAGAADAGIVSAANLNGPGQVVIAGSRDAVAKASDRAKALGAKRVVALSVSAPFDCALMTPAPDRLPPDLRAL